MTDIAAHLIARERRLTDAAGDGLPPIDDARLTRARQWVDQPAHDTTRPAIATQLPLLAAAYRHTADDVYAHAARRIFQQLLDDEVRDGQWIKPAGYDSLFIAHRLGDTEALGFFGALPVLLPSAVFDQPLLERIVEWARLQLNHLVDRRLDGRNIRVTQGDSLWTQGFRLSFLPDSEHWRHVGLLTVTDAFHRLLNEDGSSGEATGWYHFIVMNMAYRFWRIGQAIEGVNVSVPADLVARSFDYTNASVGPCGRLTRIGDCTSRVSPDGTLAAMIARRDDARAILGQPAAAQPTAQCFTGAGQAFMRSDWSPTATYLTFDATARNGFHWHPSRNSIQVQVANQRIIADPGRMSYARTPQRANAITTPSHSTINFNGWNQNDTPTPIRGRFVEGYDVVDADYSGGYWPGDMFNPGHGMFGMHHRTLLWIRERMIVVLDHVQHREGEDSKPRLECNWQFGHGQVELIRDERDASRHAGETAPPRIVSTHADQRMLMLVPLHPPGMQVSVHEGELDPTRGWVANDNDQPEPAPLVRCVIERQDFWSTHFATVMLPFTGDTPPDVRIAGAQVPGRDGNPREDESGRGPATPGQLIIEHGDGSRDEIHWTQSLEYSIEHAGDLVTDAALVHRQYAADGSRARTLVVDGTWIAGEGNPPRDAHPRPATWVEQG